MELAPVRQATNLLPSAPLAELLEIAERNRQACEDHADIPLNTTRLEEDGTWCYNGSTGRLSRHALAQLCGRLELPGGGTVPASYLARCPGPLAADNLNYWITRAKRPLQRVFVRSWLNPDSAAPTVRAILSDRYAPVDHLPLLQTLASLVPASDLFLQNWSLDDEQLTLRLSVKGEHPASLDDPLRVGLHISNSEIGLGRISITALITRLVCTNGLVVKVADLGGMHRRHIGRAGESLEEVVRTAIPRVLAEADQAAIRFTRLRREPLPQPVEPFMERTVREAELPEGLPAKALAALEGETLYDLVNAFTQVAQGYPVGERVRIETAMSRFLKLSAN